MIRREFKVGERVWLKCCALSYGPAFNTEGIIEQADNDNTSLVQWSNSPETGLVRSWHPNFNLGRIVQIQLGYKP